MRMTVDAMNILVTSNKVGSITAADLRQFAESLILDSIDLKAVVDSNTTRLITIEDSATADQTDAEIEIAYNNIVPLVTQLEAEAGILTEVRRVTPESIKQSIIALAPRTIINNTLTGISATEALSANQGTILKTLIDDINILLTSNDTTLDQLQEVVDFIKLNKSTLDALGISNIAGLQTALDTKVNNSDVLTPVPLGALFTDTITTVNNTLTSTSITEAVSAAQAKILKDVQDTQATAINLNTAKETNVTTNLTYNATPINGVVVSSDGTDAVIPLVVANGFAGLQTGADKFKLDNIEVGATADQIASEVPVTPVGDITETDVQDALEGLDTRKVSKVVGKQLSTEDFSTALKTLLETKKVKNIVTDAVNNWLVVTFTDDTTSNLNINDIVTDVNVTGATLNATTNVLTLTSDDGGVDVTVDLSDFVNSSELTNALSLKEDTANKKTNIDTNKTSDTFFPSIKSVYDWVTDWVTSLFIPKVTSTDNALARFDTTGGLVQNGIATEDDSGNISATSFNLMTGLSTVAPLMDGVATIGTSTKLAREGHIHPSDTTKFDKAGGTITGAIKSTVVNDNTMTFDLSLIDNFTSTPTVAGTLSFTNVTNRQSGNIILDNTSGIIISLGANIATDDTLLATINVAGVYWLSYITHGTTVYLSIGTTVRNKMRGLTSWTWKSYYPLNNSPLNLLGADGVAVGTPLYDGNSVILTGYPQYINAPQTIGSTGGVSIWYNSDTIPSTYPKYRHILFSTATVNPAAGLVMSLANPTGNGLGFLLISRDLEVVLTETFNSLDIPVEHIYQHIIVSWNPTDLNMYLSGKLIRSYSLSQPFAEGTVYMIGHETTGIRSAYWFKGHLSNNGITDSFLTEADAVSIYNDEKSQFGL